MTKEQQNDLDILFEHVHQRNKTDKKFLSTIYSGYRRHKLWTNIFVRICIQLLGFTLRPSNSSVKYFIWGTRFEELILTLPSNEVCVLGGPRQFIFCLKHRRLFLPSMKLWGDLAQGTVKRTLKIDKKIINYIDHFGQKISEKAAENAILVVDNDSQPMQRTIILAARRAKLKQDICIQHGIFQSKSAVDGWFAKQFFAINEHQKSILVDKGIASDKIKIMGFHSSSYLPIRSIASPGKRKICFFGQPWVKYSEKKAYRYLEIIQTAKRVLCESGYSMFYKLHPWERGAEYLRRLSDVVNVPLPVALERYDVFISLTSTALLEAEMAGRIAIQIKDDTFNCDDFSCNYNVFTTTLQNFQKNHLEFINYHEVRNNDDVIQESAAERFKKQLYTNEVNNS